MSNDSFQIGFMCGSVTIFIMCTLIYVLMVINPLTEIVKEHRLLIEQCEQYLPRNVHCELKATTAFPENNEEK